MLVQLNEHKFVKAVDIVLRNLRQVQNVLEFFGIRFCFFSFLFFPNFQIVVLFSASQWLDILTHKKALFILTFVVL